MLGRIIVEECSNPQFSQMVQKDTGAVVFKSDNSPNRAPDSNIPLIQVPTNVINQKSQCCFSHIPMLESRLKMCQMICFFQNALKLIFQHPLTLPAKQKTGNWQQGQKQKRLCNNLFHKHADYPPDPANMIFPDHMSQEGQEASPEVAEIILQSILFTSQAKRSLKYNVFYFSTHHIKSCPYRVKTLMDLNIIGEMSYKLVIVAWQRSTC